MDPARRELPALPSFTDTDMQPQLLQLNEWQVTGVHWALQQEQGPVGGGLVADDCGVGKTVLALSLVYLAAVQTEIYNNTHPGQRRPY
jgi:SNF2 family DNA or RNA helicase